jgi:hypothetical protein
MKKPAKKAVTLILFTILTIIAILTMYAMHQMPTQETVTNTLCTYSSTATYDYTAILEPNTIYQNKTTLKPDEGTIYTRITKQINLTLTYTFQASLPSEARVTYSLIENLETGALSQEIVSTSETSPNQTQFEIILQPVNKTALDAVKSTIESETGTTSSTYSLQITPTFVVNANTTAGSIQQTFVPTLTVNFEYTDQGDIISLGELQQTKTGSIKQSQATTRQDIITQQYMSYGLTAFSIIGLGISVGFYTRTPTTEKKPQFEKPLAVRKDIIIETHEELKLPRQATMVSVENIEEMYKIAEILAKPIILRRSQEQRAILTIIDQNTIYQYRTATFKDTFGIRIG